MKEAILLFRSHRMICCSAFNRCNVSKLQFEDVLPTGRAAASHIKQCSASCDVDSSAAPAPPAIANQINIMLNAKRLVSMALIIPETFIFSNRCSLKAQSTIEWPISRIEMMASREIELV